MFFISGCEGKDTKTLKGINDKLVNLDSFKELQEAGSFTNKVEDKVDSYKFIKISYSK